MTFEEAVKKTTSVAETLRPGLGALRRSDKRHLSAEDTRRIRGSLDIDNALKEAYPDANRWDYAIGHAPANFECDMIYWIEIHPATAAEVDVVLAKLEWLKQWLKLQAPELNAFHRKFVWISSGKTSFTLSSPQQKRFALLGLEHKGRSYSIPNESA